MASITPVVQVEMMTLKNLLTITGPEIAWCIRGRHAVGKSEGTYQAAAMMRDDFYKDEKNAAKWQWAYDRGLPVIERRLSQLTEGDLTGMPDLGADRTRTSFKPCDWLIDACEHPVVLFLDERNRALEGVKQAVFQLMDSRAFYGHKLHPGTRVIVAENVGDLYTVQPTDPAETSRAATVELAPSVEEWLKYASLPGRCHPLTVDFIRQNKVHLEFDPNDQSKAKKAYEPLKKYPDRRSWFKLDQQLQQTGLIDRPTDQVFYSLVAAMVGIEAAVAFTDFAKTYDRQVSVKDITTDWAKAKTRMGSSLTAPRYLELARKLEGHFKAEVLSEAQAKQVADFMHDCPPEPRMVTWAALQASHKNLFKIHKYVEELMVATATGEDSTPSAVARTTKK